MTITALPTPPSRQDPETFEERADAFLGALPQFGTEANELAANLNNREQIAVSASSAAAASANSALTSANNSLANAQNAAAANTSDRWVSGTTYAIGKLVWSPLNGRNYRRITNGSGTTDPSLDLSNWKILSVVVEQEDIGSGQNQVSLNQHLGGLAFQNPESLVLKPQASTAPQQLGDMVFELTSNTSLKVKVKGSDNVVRSVTLTLS